MRELSASIDVKSPAGFAIAFLNQYIAERADPGGEASLHLKYPLKQLAGGLVLERAVTVHVHYEPAVGDEAALLVIGWRPEDTSIFPSFNGTLLAGERGEHECTLTIAGLYDVPGGIAGLLFDVVVGARIARSTVEDLLDEFRVAIEEDYKKRMNFG